MLALIKPDMDCLALTINNFSRKKQLSFSSSFINAVICVRSLKLGVLFSVCMDAVPYDMISIDELGNLQADRTTVCFEP